MGPVFDQPELNNLRYYSARYFHGHSVGGTNPSLLEAMACGNAIIASKRGDTELFINSSNGLLIDLNKSELVSAMELLINNPLQ